MKVYLATPLLLFSLLVNAQITTSISDSIFEQRLINLGYDFIHDGWVFTDSIASIDTLSISGNLLSKIKSLDGIGFFSDLRYLDCSDNDLDSVNLNNNTNLKHIICSSNNMEKLIIDNLDELEILDCSFNNLTSIDLSQNFLLDSLECSRNNLNVLIPNIGLRHLYCGDNNLTSLDFSGHQLYALRCENNPMGYLNLENNYDLEYLTCHNNLLQDINLNDNINLKWLSIGNSPLFVYNNDLTSLDLSYNCNLTNFYSSGNLNLYCIQVCDTTQANYWTAYIDTHQYYSSHCNYTAINNISLSSPKIISIKDIYGRETFHNGQQLLFFIYEDGRVEKRIILK